MLAVESRQDTGAFSDGEGGEGDGGGERKERDGRTFANTLRGRLTTDRPRGRCTARAEYKCKRQEYAANPLTIPFTSQHSYVLAVTVRPESRGDPRVSSPPLSRLLQICIPLSERECVRQPETMRGSYSRSSNSVLLKLGYARINP